MGDKNAFASDTDNCPAFDLEKLATLSFALRCLHSEWIGPLAIDSLLLVWGNLHDDHNHDYGYDYDYDQDYDDTSTEVIMPSAPSGLAPSSCVGWQAKVWLAVSLAIVLRMCLAICGRRDLVFYAIECYIWLVLGLIRVALASTGWN